MLVLTRVHRFSHQPPFKNPHPYIYPALTPAGTISFKQSVETLALAFSSAALIHCFQSWTNVSAEGHS